MRELEKTTQDQAEGNFVIFNIVSKRLWSLPFQLSHDLKMVRPSTMTLGHMKARVLCYLLRALKERMLLSRTTQGVVSRDGVTANWVLWGNWCMGNCGGREWVSSFLWTPCRLADLNNLVEWEGSGHQGHPWLSGTWLWSNKGVCLVVPECQGPTSEVIWNMEYLEGNSRSVLFRASKPSQDSTI